MTISVEDSVAPAAVERALMIYEWMKERDRATLIQARKVLTERIYAMVNAGEVDDVRLIVGGLTCLKDRERLRSRDRLMPPRRRAVPG